MTAHTFMRGQPGSAALPYELPGPGSSERAQLAGLYLQLPDDG